MTADYHAFGAFDGAFSRTKSLLWPFNLGIWLRLAVIAFFIGGFGGGGGSNYSFPDRGGRDMSSMPVPDFFGLAPTTFFLILAAVIVLALLFAYVGSVFQFVLVDCLTSGPVSLSRTFRERMGHGLSFFLFEILLAFVFIAVMVGFVVFGFVTGIFSGVSNVIALLVLIPVILLLALVVGVVLMLTVDFVVPVMIADRCGIVEGWRRVYGILRADLKNAAVYVVVKVILAIVAALIMGILGLIVLAIIGVPLFIVALLAGFFANGPSMIWALVLLIVIGILIALPFLLLLQVPFVTFFRFYSLDVLRRFSPAHDLLAEPEGDAAA
ncbi:DUF7544 domain-containing protein [Methanofollis ethanolicus]|uniref:DUF7544 domain-containing protein n=1 Tax=Methanofollis ethanolicus TaxID=488124 RepID=UPI0008343AB3|nr:hypothetical protein [Methanofollis ethanolicus]